MPSARMPNNVARTTAMHPPSIDALLKSSAFAPLVMRYGRMVVRNILREMNQQRSEVGHFVGHDALLASATERLDRSIGSGAVRVFNMTGVLLHSNLGRAVLDADTSAAIVREASGHVALELSARTGKRGNRESAAATAICALTGSEAAALVNNNAAAVMLMLAALKSGARNQVIVSRGELVEIGGSFRLPDIMRAANVKLIEVGTTNVTRPSDYLEAINARTAAILKVHTSNYAVRGHTSAASLRALRPIAEDKGVPLCMDAGSGCLIDMTKFGLPKEPHVSEAIKHGARLVTFSGDKLLGSVQAGFLIGDKSLIARINRHPMKRSLRLDKIRLALLVETLKAYQSPQTLSRRVPLFRALARSHAELEASAAKVCETFTPVLDAGHSCRTVHAMCEMGSGSMPGVTLESRAVEIRAPSQAALKRFDVKLRSLPTPVLGRIHAGTLLLDLRAIDDLPRLLANLRELAGT
ncbi:MAG: L-seryl-tRNA(Sec) selenium transferase [Gammaproteobacteria bacterium]|nr:L-seryl-tRNA(Sec) selenium transferase [Gammaproteobacteria bacterium]